MPDTALNHPVVSREEWLAARRRLLAREEEAEKLRSEVAAERQALPWVRMEKSYRFHTVDGEKTLGELFGGNSQLVIYHFMFGPDWEAGCEGCSFLADHVDGALPHLNHHDVTWIAVSRAPLHKIEAYKKRMGWRFPWVSSQGSDFNFDFQVSFTPEALASGKVSFNFAERPDIAGTEMPGLSAFYKDADGTVFHSYSGHQSWVEHTIGTLMILDQAPLGRNETEGMDFVRRHDEYEAATLAACCHADSK